jgi:hypothetical protein
MRARFGALTLATALALGSSQARAQSYGLEPQVLTIGAAEFQSAFSTFRGDIGSDGYLYYSGEAEFHAPLSLPDGALIERICLYANDSDPGGFVAVGLHAVELVSAGGSPSHVAYNGPSSSSEIGYGYYCVDAGYVVRGELDVDGDGILHPVAFYVDALVPPATENSLGFGGVRITWRRQVSAPLGQTFADVPSSDPGFGYIEALAASGTTAGCSPTDYCPGANLTRRQMAVFLSKALGLQWADATP